MPRAFSFVVSVSSSLAAIALALGSASAAQMPEPGVTIRPAATVSAATAPPVAAVQYDDPSAPGYTRYVPEAEVARLAALVGLPVSEALNVTACESGLASAGYGHKDVRDTLTVGLYGERGIWQIHPMHLKLIRSLGYTWDDMFRPEPNARVARVLYDLQGWGGWSCGD